MEDYQAILDVFDQHHSFALSVHINPDGDAVGSELALYSFLRDLGKQVRVFNTDAVPDNYHFLPFSEVIQGPDDVQDYSPEILVILDASTRMRIGDKLCRTLIPTKAVVNIDHHDTGDRFGDYNLVETDASSTSEIIFRLIKHREMPIGRDRALCLYTGIMFDTGCFRYNNSAPVAHRIAAELIEQGNFPVDGVYRQVYESVSIGKMRLLAEVLQTLNLTQDGKIGWLWATQEMFRKTGTTPDDVEGFVNHVRAIDSVEVSIFVSELEDGRSKASLRSEAHVDVGKVAADFDGGGHQRASGCVIHASHELAVKRLVENTQKRMRSITNGNSGR
ncbi:MAG: bifunctional oligoribonuclease/PAP phosphatase NrnA [Candidatus Poribacteria bacterium]|nr:bifunctional oligoribonuclease/PAP phosphatase NrnA [Candidatus Poribacteria bacterium]MDE0506071.1 bifunctional oligoribonuclease/PAP phosphatase NrnA [Candidatus Poribacteria bacterium]